MSIASSLFSDSQTRLLPWLFGQPERSYHLSELRRLTALGSASLQRELNRLEESQLVQSTRVGNLRCFQANAQSPVYAELVALTRKTMGAAPLVLQALQSMAANISTAFIFGSVAKGTDTANSDVDVLLVGDGLVLSDILQLLLPIETMLGRKINVTLAIRCICPMFSTCQRPIRLPNMHLPPHPHEFLRLNPGGIPKFGRLI